MYEFRIVGEISNSGWYGDMFTSDMLLEHLALANGKDLLIDINSIGGCVTSGMAMFAELRRYAKKHNATITTRTSGFVASIATAIFLAGDKRIVNEYLQPFVHEPLYAWNEDLHADDFQKSANDLAEIRSVLADFYSKNTNLSKDEALELMKNDTWITAKKCLSIGFATEIEDLNTVDAKIVASLLNKYNPKNDKMSKETKEKASRWDALAKLFGGNSAVAVVELKTATQDVITFPDIDELSEIEEGVRGLVNGETADGEFSVELEGEVKTLIFTDGTLTSILDVEEELEGNDELEARIEMLADAMISMKEENDKLKAKIEANEKLVASLKGVSSSFDKKIAKLQNAPKDKKKSGEFKNSYLENYKK